MNSLICVGMSASLDFSPEKGSHLMPPVWNRVCGGGTKGKARYRGIGMRSSETTGRCDKVV